MGRADQRGAGVEGDRDRERFEQRLEAALGGEAGHEVAVLDDLEHLGRDAAADVDAAHRDALEGQIRGLGAVDRGEEFDRPDADRVRPGQARLRDRRAGVGGLHLLGQPVRLGLVARRAEELVNIIEPRPREHPLVADVPVELGPEERQQGVLLRVLRRERRMPALGCDRVVARTVPVEHRLAQPGAGGDHGDVSLATRRGAGVDDMKLLRFEVEHAVGGGFEVVQELRPGGADGLREFDLVEHPGQIGGLALAVDDRAGDAEAAGGDGGPFAGDLREELGDDLLEGGVLLAGEDPLADLLEFLARPLVEAEDRLGAADVTGQDHVSLPSTTPLREARAVRVCRVGWKSKDATTHRRSLSLRLGAGSPTSPTPAPGPAPGPSPGSSGRPGRPRGRTTAARRVPGSGPGAPSGSGARCSRNRRRRAGGCARRAGSPGRGGRGR